MTTPCHNGLSPHGRGKPRRHPFSIPRRRSIPARAGETCVDSSSLPMVTVYPRTGGGNSVLYGVLPVFDGLSPHGRGKPPEPRLPAIPSGSIPARAGETPGGVVEIRSVTVYPRTGGGNGSGLQYQPAMRGLSPHGRGKHTVGRPHPTASGSIPARAGETPLCRFVVLPRFGLSPHGRGKPPGAGFHPRLLGSIPARAGETARRRAPGPGPGVYPRTGGGNYIRSISTTPPGGLSPHGRGKHIRRQQVKLVPRSIPARAGETEQYAGSHTA